MYNENNFHILCLCCGFEADKFAVSPLSSTFFSATAPAYFPQGLVETKTKLKENEY